MDDTLQDGIKAAKNGDKTQAFQLLIHAARNPATAEQAWLWLSSVVDADSEKLYCLNYALKINPANAAAQRGATALVHRGILPAVPVYPEAAKKVAQAVGPSRPVPTSHTPPTSTVAAPLTPMTGVSTVNKTAIPTAQAISPSQAVKPAAQKQDASGLYRFAATELAKNRPPQLVEKLLISQGTSPQLANRVVTQTRQALIKSRRNKSKKRMIWGLIWFFGGILVTALTYTFADYLGGSFYIFYGAVIFGLIDFFIGLGGWLADR